MRKAIFFLAVTALLFSCSGRPEENIVGEWEFDRMEQLNGQKMDPLTQQLLSQMIGSMNIVYTDQGRYTTTTAMSVGPEQGKYWLEDGGASLVAKPDLTGIESRSKIIKLNNDELILSSEGEVALVFRKKK